MHQVALILMLQIASIMLREKCRRVFFKFPFRYPAVFAGPAYPFVSKPARCSGISGIIDSKGFAAMGRYFCIVSLFIYGTDSMKNSSPGWPEFYFIKQQKQFYLFPVVSFFFVAHVPRPSCCVSLRKNNRSDVRTE